MDELLSIALFIQPITIHKTPFLFYGLHLMAKKPKLSHWDKLRQRMNYPWSKWADGKKHTIRPGKDFKVTPRHMASAIYSYCRRNKRKATVSLMDGVVTFLIE